ncbi:MAG TPA: cytochrome b/b6 domain-containing protein [Planctomycetota bacterium]|nr:cytochrome b/b6 domain-containing protein [Planctomycetota bacterium]
MTIKIIVATVLLCGTVYAAEELKDSVCFKCHKEEKKAKFQDGTEVSIFIDKVRFAASVHGVKEQHCVGCHTDLNAANIADHPEKVLKDPRSYSRSMAGVCVTCHKDEAAKFPDDVHSRVTTTQVLCTDCHGTHYMHSPNHPRAAVPQTCAKCHPDINAKYSQSVHGKALLGENNPDVPVCVDCHRAHSISKAKTADFHLDSVNLCKRCHGDATKMKKYGLSTDVMQTYLQDFHGVSVSYSRKTGIAPSDIKATCIDCHGAHTIPRKDSAAALTTRANVVKACQKCHADATEEFSSAWLSHYIPSPTHAPVVFAVQLFYRAFIPFMVIGLLVLIVLDLRHLRRSKGHIKPAVAGPDYVRFSLFRRVEHVLIMLSFTLLVVTGVPQEFSDQGWAEWMILAMGGIERLRIIHRFVGIAFAVVCAGHVLLNVVWLLQGRIFGDMMVTRKDFTDTIASIKLAMGLPAEEPKFGRYEFRQKFEYWGMLLGGGVMIATGFILLWPMIFARVLPGQFIAAAKVAHSFEAVMALLVIVIWHLYCAVLRPTVFPLDKSIFTGKISHEKMLEEHPLELERLEKAKAGA